MYKAIVLLSCKIPENGFTVNTAGRGTTKLRYPPERLPVSRVGRPGLPLCEPRPEPCLSNARVPHEGNLCGLVLNGCPSANWFTLCERSKSAVEDASLLVVEHRDLLAVLQDGELTAGLWGHPKHGAALPSSGIPNDQVASAAKRK